MKNKRAQSEVITTVLIILLVIAAVFIVYTAVRGMVQGSTDTAVTKANCIGISFDVTAGTAADTVNVLRNAGGPTENVGLKFVVGGLAATATETTTLGELESATYTLAPAIAGKKVQVAAEGCDISGEVTISAE